MKRKSKILVAMSGGVDSSVAAMILKNQGHEVAGAFMIFEEKDNKCCSLESQATAKKVAKQINIPFYRFDFKKEFQKKIISQFVDDYKRGRTPNPCVDCNEKIKFGLFIKKARALGFDLIATGHYAGKKEESGDYKLMKGRDKTKDQSYFLWKLNQNQLKNIIFPLGKLTKKEVYKLAEDNNLPSFKAKESQEVCFVKTNTFDFLKRKIGQKEGDIIGTDGKKLGRHKGTHLYTIGQRKGLGLSGGPFFITNKDTRENTLIVSKKKTDLVKKEMLLKDINWISGKMPKLPLRAKVKIRYGHEGGMAGIRGNKVIFDAAQKAIASGQSAVFYKRNELLGGGVILE